jgi:5-methylcytosine-specific restriction protein A
MRRRGLGVAKITARNSFDKTKYGESWERVKAKVPLAGRRCSECNGTIKLQRHHTVPISKGGQHSVSNVTILCENCHDKEHKHSIKRRKK